MAKQRAKYTAKITYSLIVNGRQLPYQYSLEDSADLSVRAKAEKRGYSHGSTITGDGYIDGKKIKLGFLISGTNQADYNKNLNELLRIFYQRDYKLSTCDGYYNVACMASCAAKWIKGYKGVKADVDVTLLLADPFRYADEESGKAGPIINDDGGATVTVVNMGSVDTPLTITIIPRETLSDITVRHVETGKIMRVADTLLTRPAMLTVDTKAGTVRRDTYNAINAFSGHFLTAKPGTNNYEIKGSSIGKIVIQWRNRWLA